VLFHFQFDFSDIDRGIYETLDFRLYQHPSEISAYLLTRALAYALSYKEGLEFSTEGLSDPEAPALRSLGKHGTVDLWIEIGNPSAKKLHKAGKTARQVIVYTYKSADVLKDDIKKNDVYRATDLEIYSIDMAFLNNLEKGLKSNNKWTVLCQQGQLSVGIGNDNFTTEVRKHSVT
jgi:uncharacterized protein YaeQ